MTRESVVMKYRHFKYLLFILPAFALWFVFALLPNLQVFWLSLFEWNGISEVKKYVGLDNFRKFFILPELSFRIIGNTFFYILFLSILVTILATLLAVVLKKNTGFNRLFRSMVFFPFVLSTVAVGLTWGLIYDPNFGIISAGLQVLGFSPIQKDWLGIPVFSVLMIVLTQIWHGLGVPVTISIAGLMSIPETLYEAAVIEGAGSANKFFRITLPLFLPTLSRIMLLNTISGALAFDYIFVIRNAMMTTQYDTMAAHMYRSMMSSQSVGLTSSIGVMISIFVFIVFLIQFVVTKKIENAIS